MKTMIMKQLKNRFALFVFDMIALVKGFRFERVRTTEQEQDIDMVYGEEGFAFPDGLQEDVRAYKDGAINFIAYFNNTPVGMVRLANPDVVNRPYELYGVDIDGEHSEIQSLLVRKAYREGTQFVMLGLFKAMYTYSVRHGIESWSSCGTRSVYLTMRRFCKKIEVEDVDFSSIMHPLTQYLFRNKIIDTYFTMEVASFEPWSILRRCIKQMTKSRTQVTGLFNLTKNIYACISYGCK